MSKTDLPPSRIWLVSDDPHASPRYVTAQPDLFRVYTTAREALASCGPDERVCGPFTIFNRSYRKAPVRRKKR